MPGTRACGQVTPAAKSPLRPPPALAKRHQVQQEALVSIALGLADGGEARRKLKNGSNRKPAGKGK